MTACCHKSGMCVLIYTETPLGHANLSVLLDFLFYPFILLLDKLLFLSHAGKDAWLMSDVWPLFRSCKPVFVCDMPVEWEMQMESDSERKRERWPCGVQNRQGKSLPPPRLPQDINTDQISTDLLPLYTQLQGGKKCYTKLHNILLFLDIWKRTKPGIDQNNPYNGQFALIWIALIGLILFYWIWWFQSH